MSTDPQTRNPPDNQLLKAMPPKAAGRIIAACDQIELKFGTVLIEPGETIAHIIFPECGIISLLSTVNSASMLEIGLVGNEGMIGVPAFLGVERSNNQAIVQGSGSGLRLGTKPFLEECARDSDVSRILMRYVYTILAQVSQSAICNRFHYVGARLARWLLLTHDRMRADEFQMTHNFLSNMLGVRREAVSLAAGQLQQKKLIEYSRGRIRILDRAGLEDQSCACYELIRRDH